MGFVMYQIHCELPTDGDHAVFGFTFAMDKRVGDKRAAIQWAHTAMKSLGYNDATYYTVEVQLQP